MEWDNMNTSKKGAVAEYMAANWLLSKGYEVFKNLTPTGKVDIIAWKGEEMHLIDVALCSRSKRTGGYSDNKKGVAESNAHLGIKILCVLDTGDCVWRDDLFKSFPDKKCHQCGNTFTPTKGNEVVCGDNCRRLWVAKMNKDRYNARKSLP